jgi:isoaspartyl peptidase/L-asparaginase-like protein (Ntn-hydrolase superfamily)
MSPLSSRGPSLTTAIVGEADATMTVRVTAIDAVCKGLDDLESAPRHAAGIGAKREDGQGIPLCWGR